MPDLDDIGMAIMVRNPGLLFVQNGGTGCSSVGKYLRSHLEGEVIGKKHASLPELLDEGVLSRDRIRDYTVFDTVRNAFDRVATAYQRLAGGEWKRFLEDRSSWVYRGDPRYPEILRKDIAFAENNDFETWVTRSYGFSALTRMRTKALLGIADPVYREQIRMTRLVDTCIRFERLEEGLKALLGRVGVDDPGPLSNVNPTRGKTPYRELYTAKARRIVERVYRGELRRFGYAFTGPRSGEPLIELRRG